ncbi:MAG TPA: shikimate dehydrogenase [Bryobacteraceae bacterium]|nr:shikimate dehydrogenase [Bryobacteraceae bacterium]
MPRICVALGLSSPDELDHAAEVECKDGNCFLEFRLDYLKDPAAGIEVLRRFLKKHPDATILATCRHAQHHGHFKGTVDQQLAILSEAAAAGAAVVDVEIESAECAKAAVAQLRKRATLLLSFHDFERTPALEQVLRRLQKITADIYKVVTTAVKLSDNARLIEFARAKHDVPVIALAMSDIGTSTRILGPSFGSPFTYAAPGHGHETAPGQVSARLMRSLYHCDKLTKKSRVYGVVADPVAHSKSPFLHNRAFQTKRLDAVYLPFRVPATQLADFMKLAGSLPVHGFSVTIPHKQKILRYLDVVEPLAKRIGAVNTVWRKAGKWRGANTDTEGVLKPLAKQLRLPHASVLIVGYGGAARAAAIALADAGAKVTITGRKLESAQALARVVKAEAVSLNQAERSFYDALVHATPVGMTPKPDDALFRNTVPADVVLDMVYNPHETALLKHAKAEGRTVIHGMDMLLEQAFCQFEIWTGEAAPRSVMQEALEQQMLANGH